MLALSHEALAQHFEALPELLPEQASALLSELSSEL
jgi:hypothetical protein